MSNDISQDTSISLAIPDPRHEMVPPGWFEEMAVPAVSQITDWDALDEIEARIKAIAAYITSFDGDELEFEKAMRLVEKRRGDLLGQAEHGGDRRSAENQVPRMGLDIPKQTASRYRKLASRWDDLLYPKLIEATKRAQVSQTHLLKLIDEAEPRPDKHIDGMGDGWATRHGDFREVLDDIKPGSVDLIVTDPPYPNKYLPLWSDLAALAKKVLHKRGLLFAYSGKIQLPEVMRRLEEHLTYGWMFSLELPGSQSRIMGRHIIQSWKPVLAYSTGTWPSGKWGDDRLISPAREKTRHEWEQHSQPVERIIERYAPINGFVIDPFMGTGAFGIAARNTGRQFLGVELDSDRYQKATDRLANLP